MKRALPLVVLSLCAALGLSSAAHTQEASSPVGLWESVTGDSRYEVRPCGGENRLCAKLTWLRSDARTPENLAYLNKNIINAVQVEDNKWRGTLKFDGQSFGGSMVLVDDRKLKLSGCALVFCQDFEFNRI